MRLLIITYFFLLGGCAYTQPVLVKNEITDIGKLIDIAKKLDMKNSTIEVQSSASNSDVIVMYPLDSRVPWQVLTYTVKDIQRLFSTIFNNRTQGRATCKTIIYVENLSHETHPVGLNYAEVYIKGNFIVTSSCEQFTPCNLYAEYQTGDSFWTPSIKNKRYSEAIIGVILNAAIAAQSCSSENEN